MQTFAPIFKISSKFRKILQISRMVRSAAPPRASTSEKANFSYLIAENYQQHSTRTRERRRLRVPPGTTAPSEDAVSGRVGFPVQVGQCSFALEVLGRPRSTESRRYKAQFGVLHVTAPNAIYQTQKLRGGERPPRTRGQTMASGDDRVWLGRVR